MLKRLLLLALIALVANACSQKEEPDEKSPSDVQQIQYDTNFTPEPDTNTDLDVTPDGGALPEEPCTPGERKCILTAPGKTSAVICNDTGIGYTVQECVNGTFCSGGYCKLITCNPGELLGQCFNDNAYEVCAINGTEIELVYCDTNSPICLDGKCQKLLCKPGTKRCKGTGAIEKCADDGSKYEVLQLCGPGNICSNAQCNTACDVNIKANTYTGCEYWAVDLDNIEGGKYKPVAVVVSNPDSAETASVTITNMAKGEDVALPTSTVPPLGQEVFLLPKGHDLEGSMKSNSTFRIKASAPVTVHQFNPLNADKVFSNDASLLLPSNVSGSEFLIMSWPQRQADKLTNNIPLRGFLTVIAVEKEGAKVTIKSPINIEHGEGIETLPANVEGVYSLKYGEVLNLESGGGISGPDLTGTLISSDRRVTVFSGHECANVPLIVQEGVFKGTKFCDHIESQAFPVDTWGSRYVAAAFSPRSPGQKDVWRIMSGANGVTINTDPPQPASNGVTLNKGQFVEFESKDNFFVVASGPVSLGHYLKGSNYVGYEPLDKCAKSETDLSGIGDPAFTLTPPTLQMRSDYIVLTPQKDTGEPYYAENYINLSYQVGTEILLDGNPVPMEPVPVGVSPWNVQTIAVEPGVHRIESIGGQPIGVTAYGYDCDVSYAYPGGLNLDPDAKEID